MEEGSWLFIAMSTFHSECQDSNSSKVPPLLRLVLCLRTGDNLSFHILLSHIFSMVLPETSQTIVKPRAMNAPMFKGKHSSSV